MTASGAPSSRAGRAASVPVTAGEQIATTDPVQRVRVGVALTSATSLNVAGSIATTADQNVNSLVSTQLWLGDRRPRHLPACSPARWSRDASADRPFPDPGQLLLRPLLALVAETGCRYASTSLVSQ